MERRLVVVKRDCPARLVPTGTPVMVPGGTFVTLTQSLGGTYTIVYNGNMARIDGADADALGFEVELPNYEANADGSINLDHVHDTAVVRAYDRGERRSERERLALWWDEQLVAERPLLRLHGAA